MDIFDTNPGLYQHGDDGACDGDGNDVADDIDGVVGSIGDDWWKSLRWWWWWWWRWGWWSWCWWWWWESWCWWWWWECVRLRKSRSRREPDPANPTTTTFPFSFFQIVMMIRVFLPLLNNCQPTNVFNWFCFPELLSSYFWDAFEFGVCYQSLVLLQLAIII